MNSEAVLKLEGMRVLSEKLGLVEAERFIVLMNKEPFDYTKWQRNLFGDTPLDEFLSNAAQYQKMKYGG
jgi:hypothetical protein